MKDREKRFCDEYLIDGNASRSYVAAGYSPKNPDGNAYKMLQKQYIIDYIKTEQAKTSKKLEITREDLIQDLVDIKDSQKEEFPNTAIKAIEVIAKMLGLNEPEKQDITSNGNQITGFEINIKKPLND
jgi:phage terminase small subunit